MANRNRKITASDNEKRENNLKAAGKRIAVFRREAGKSQADLAADLNLSTATVSEIECGKNQIIHNYIDIANILNVSLNDIFCDCLSNSGTSIDSDICEMFKNASSKQKNMIRDVISSIIKYPDNIE